MWSRRNRKWNKKESRLATLNFFTGFLDLCIDFFLNGFPNPFVVDPTPSFLFPPEFHFSFVVFLFTCGILTWIFRFFSIFLSDFQKWFSKFTHSPF